MSKIELSNYDIMQEGFISRTLTVAVDEMSDSKRSRGPKLHIKLSGEGLTTRAGFGIYLSPESARELRDYLNKAVITEGVTLR